MYPIEESLASCFAFVLNYLDPFSDQPKHMALTAKYEHQTRTIVAKINNFLQQLDFLPASEYGLTG